MRIKRADLKEADSILQAAKRDMAYTLTVPIIIDSASTVIRNTHECFRMLGDALLLSRGIEPEDHIEPIREIMRLHVVTPRPLQILESIGVLRHHLNYYGYRPTTAEAEDIMSFAKGSFHLVASEVERILKRT